MPLAAASPIAINLWTFLFQAINVLIVMAVLYWFLFRPVSAIIARREETIESSLERAARAREEAERLAKEYQAKLDAAAREAHEVVDKATRAAEETRQRIVKEAQDEAARTLEKAKREIALEREKALASIRDEVANLAILAAGKVVGKSLTAADHQRLVQEFVADIQQQRNGARH